MDRSGRSSASRNESRSFSGSINNDDDDFRLGPNRVYSPLAESPKAGAKKLQNINVDRLNELLGQQNPAAKSPKTKMYSSGQKPKLMWLNNRLVIVDKAKIGGAKQSSSKQPLVKRSAETTVEMSPNGAAKSGFLKALLHSNCVQKVGRAISPFSVGFGADRNGGLVALPDVGGTRPVLASSPHSSSRSEKPAQKKKPNGKAKSVEKSDRSQSSGRNVQKPQKSTDQSSSSRRKAVAKPKPAKSLSNREPKKGPVAQSTPLFSNLPKGAAVPMPAEAKKATGMPINFDDLCDCGLCKRMKKSAAAAQNAKLTESEVLKSEAKGIKLPIAPLPISGNQPLDPYFQRNRGSRDSSLRSGATAKSTDSANSWRLDKSKGQKAKPTESEQSKRQTKGVKLPLTQLPIAGIQPFGLYFDPNRGSRDSSQRPNRSGASPKSTDSANSLRLDKSNGGKGKKLLKYPAKLHQLKAQSRKPMAAKPKSVPADSSTSERSKSPVAAAAKLGALGSRLSNLLKHPFGGAATPTPPNQKSQSAAKPTTAGAKCSTCKKKSRGSAQANSSTESNRQTRSQKQLAQKFAELPKKQPTAAEQSKSSGRKSNQLRMVMKIGDVTVPIAVDLGKTKKEIRPVSVELGNQKLYEAKSSGSDVSSQ